MKTRKLLFVLLLGLCTIISINAQEIKTRTLYRGGVYGQTFELEEYSDGNKCRLLLFMADNKTKITKTYDQTMQTVYFIWSKWFTNPAEYSNAIEKSKSFLEYTMLAVSMAEMKDTCDIAPCCKLLDYSIKDTREKEKYIHIEYECSDLELLFDVAWAYMHGGRAEAFQKVSTPNPHE